MTVASRVIKNRLSIRLCKQSRLWYSMTAEMNVPRWLRAPRIQHFSGFPSVAPELSGLTLTINNESVPWLTFLQRCSHIAGMSEPCRAVSMCHFCGRRVSSISLKECPHGCRSGCRHDLRKLFWSPRYFGFFSVKITEIFQKLVSPGLTYEKFL